MNPRSNRTLLLLRFVIEPPPVSTEPELFSSAPSTPLTTELQTSETIAASSPEASLVLAPIVGGVAGGTVIIGALLFAVVVCLIVAVRRKENSKIYSLIDTPGDVIGMTNMIYDAGAGHQLSSSSSSLSTGYHLYSQVNSQTNKKSKETSLVIVENEYAYAEASTRSSNSYHEPDVSTAYDQVPSYDSARKEEEEEEDLYMVPAMDEEGLYSQLDTNRTQTLSRECLKFGEELGSGQFGVVYKGIWHSSKGDLGVAVKTLREGAEKEDKVKFLQEAAIMGQFKHCNVVAMHGVITTGEPILIVLELLLKGDLKKHLLQFHFTEEEIVDIDDHTLLSYCRQVASGMAYLSNKAFVHRDLAARNILVSDDDTCKIADFGMSRDLMNEDYYISHGGKIPVKWTAPEALHYKKYSTASDVWSYGVVMYEIWSLGLKPYKDVTNEKALKIVDSGYRLPPPPGCPRALYNIMIQCWHPETSQRPLFPEISRQLSLPDSKLLKWSEEDKAVHPEAAKLGADLLSAQELYKDLQTTHST